MSLMSTAAPAPSTPLAALARPGGPPPAEGEDTGFAQALEAASARAPEAPAADEAGDAAASETRDGKRSRALRRTPNAALPTAEAAETARRGAPPVAEAESDAAPQGTGDEAASPDDTLAAWVDSLPLPPVPPTMPTTPAPANAAAPTARGGKDAVEGERGRSPGVAAVLDAAAGRAAEAGADARTQDPASANAANPSPTLPALAAALHARGAAQSGPTGNASPTAAEAVAARPTPPREMAVQSPASSDPLALAAPLAAPWTAALSRAAEPAPVAQAEVRAEVGTPEFAPALASQLSVLVRDGIEQAQLKLNPAELGPIEVRISIDGSQAQVDFSAAHATTRQALQEAVPALAATLRESGLTLSGGGVFEQPRDPRGEARGDGPRGGGREPEGPREAGLAGLAPAPLPRARGVLDLYA